MHESVLVSDVLHKTASSGSTGAGASDAELLRNSKVFKSFLERVSASGIEEMRKLYTELDTVEQAHRNIASLFLQVRWADLDFVDAVEFSNHLSSKSERFRALEMLLIYRATTDYGASLSAAKSLNSGPERDVLIDMIIRSGGTGGVAFLKRLMDESGGNMESLLIYVSYVAESDPSGAATQVMRIKDFSSRQRALDSILALWAGQNFTEAKAWLDQHLGGDELTAATHSLYRHIIPINPKASIQLIKDFPAGQLKVGLVRSLGMALFEASPATAMSWAEQELGSVQRSELFYGFAQSLLAGDDVEGAKRFVDLLPFGSSRDVLQGNIAEYIASRNVDSALEWLGQMDQNDAHKAAPIVLSEWAKRDPNGAAKYAAEHSGSSGQNLLESVMNNWGAADPKAALKWVAGIDVKLREGAETAIIKSWSSAEPDKAAVYISTMGECPQKNNLLEAVLKIQIS